nr:hypothetical protein [uncultured Agathobaculum sp.]
MQKVHAARLSARKEGLAGRELISACLRAQRRMRPATAHSSHGRRARGALAAAGCGRMQKGGRSMQRAVVLMHRKGALRRGAVVQKMKFIAEEMLSF